MIETTTMPILVVDSSGVINGWNANVAKLIGLPIGEIMGQSLVKGLILEDFVEFALQGMVLICYGIQFIFFCSHM